MIVRSSRRTTVPGFAPRGLRTCLRRVQSTGTTAAPRALLCQAASAEVTKGEEMRVWVDGHVYAGDPRAIKLGDHTDIVIEVGAPFTTPKPFTAWNGAQ